MPQLVDLCQVSSAPAPHGQSNFDDPASLAATTIAVETIMVAWAAAFTAARLHINIRKLGLGEYFALVALLISISFLGYGATQLRLTRHIWDVPACYIDPAYAKWIYFSAILLQVGQFFAKASIFHLINKLFTIHRTMRIAVWIGYALIFIVYAAGIAVATYFETPRIHETWMDTFDGRTIKPIHWWQAQSALVVALDFYIFVLPLPTLSRLNMPLMRRIRIIAVFSLALMGIGASIASLVLRVRIAREADTTWISSVLTLCSSVELNIAIIVSSAPGFVGMARPHMSKLSSYFRSKTTDSEDGLPGVMLSFSDPDGSNNARATRDIKAGNNRRYYELHDTWLTKSEGSTHDESSYQATTNKRLIDGGIMRTVDLRQDITTGSATNLVP